MHKIPTVTNDFQFQPCCEVNFLAVGTAAAATAAAATAIEQPTATNARWQISCKKRNFPISGLGPMPSVKCQNVEKIHLTLALSYNLSYHSTSHI